MPEITINDESMNASAGDNILTLARRKALHIWFVCDGRGLCQTCECRVLSGAENLSPPSKIELEVMSDSRRERGYRLACQTTVAGEGSVKLTSIAEELRRKAVAVVEGAEGSTWFENAGKLARGVTRFSLDFARSAPAAAIRVLPQIAAMPPDIEGIGRYFADARRVVERVLRDTKSLGENAAK